MVECFINSCDVCYVIREYNEDVKRTGYKTDSWSLAFCGLLEVTRTDTHTDTQTNKCDWNIALSIYGLFTTSIKENNDAVEDCMPEYATVHRRKLYAYRVDKKYRRRAERGRDDWQPSKMRRCREVTQQQRWDTQTEQHYIGQTLRQQNTPPAAGNLQQTHRRHHVFVYVRDSFWLSCCRNCGHVDIKFVLTNHVRLQFLTLHVQPIQVNNVYSSHDGIETRRRRLWKVVTTSKSPCTRAFCVTHPRTNRDQCWLTSLIRPTPLTITPRRQPVYQYCPAIHSQCSTLST